MLSLQFLWETLGHFISFNFATKEIKGVIFPLEQMIWKFNLKKRCLK